MPLRVFLFVVTLTYVFQNQGFSQDSVAVVGKIAIEGNRKTKDYIIRRELQFKVGDTLKISKINEILETDRKKIINTNLFITVKLSSKNLENNQIEILIEVKERLYFIGVPVFYLADRNFNEWWYERNRDLKRTIYGVMARHYNLSGNNDQLRVKAEFGFIPNFEISYGRPYVDKSLKTGIWAGVVYITNKTMAYRTWNDKLQFEESEKRQRERWNYYVSISRRTGFYQNQFLELSYNRAIINESIAKLNPNYFLEGRTRQQYFLLNYVYQFDRRDNQQYALKGHRVFLSATKYGLLPSDDVNQLNFSAGYAYFKPLGHKFYANLSMKGKLSFPKEQPYVQTIGLGYRNDLVRGYELYVIDAQHYVLTRTNLKYQLFDRVFDLSKFLKIKQLNTLPVATYLNSFFDMGYTKNYFPERSNSKLANTFLMGGGVGLDVVTWYNVVGRLNYSINKMNEKRLFFTVTRDF